jgi:hypothetical protein
MARPRPRGVGAERPLAGPGAPSSHLSQPSGGTFGVLPEGPSATVGHLTPLQQGLLATLAPGDWRLSADLAETCGQPVATVRAAARALVRRGLLDVHTSGSREWAFRRLEALAGVRCWCAAEARHRCSTCGRLACREHVSAEGHDCSSTALPGGQEALCWCCGWRPRHPENCACCEGCFCASCCQAPPSPEEAARHVVEAATGLCEVRGEAAGPETPRTREAYRALYRAHEVYQQALVLQARQGGAS